MTHTCNTLPAKNARHRVAFGAFSPIFQAVVAPYTCARSMLVEGVTRGLVEPPPSQSQQGRLGPPGRVGGARSVQARVLGCGSSLARWRACVTPIRASRSTGFRPIGRSKRHLQVLVRPTLASMSSSWALASRRLSVKLWLLRVKQLHRTLLKSLGV